ncbi:pyrazinamidase / nicotinamidase [Campylobacter avium LMG 24591]|uniref:nicotinamidase n=1 Tax=Campylobacter avium LMG 24591 TaxID=522484 RepID=A0A222MYS7_9BACT|nr:cysteine hydrolase family protein [Campylobacter avium]ASQ30961.1 pyrazinamidase / nicotinamidase [Campylobacter avium LMG 24591]OYD78773.1 pyrazinamidase / nicotinamidase [Campylobacter avium]
MKKALVVVDYQNDFIDGSLGFEKAALIKENILSLLKNFNGDFLFTFDTHYEDYLDTREGKNLPILHCQDESLGHKMPSDFDIYLKKARKIFKKQSFGSLELANFIKEEQYKSIEFCGLVSHICVFSNIILAFNAALNAEIVLHQNACASFDDELEEAAFKILKAYGVKILSTTLTPTVT